jgi:hypothetical protein
MPRCEERSRHLRLATIAFWDHHLLDITDASDELIVSAAEDGLNIFVYDEG